MRVRQTIENKTLTIQLNGTENQNATLSEFRTLKDFYNKYQDFQGDDSCGYLL